MRTNAIVRIILFSLAILILLGILVTSLSVDLFMFHADSFTDSDSTLPLANDGFTNTSVADASEIQNLEIEWAAGSIQILRDANASGIKVAESNNEKDKYNMVCQKSGNTLKIQFCEDSIKFPSFGINADVSKDLVICVPNDWICSKLEIDAASANLHVTDLTIHEVDFDGASGECVFDNCHVDTLDLDTASGDVEFSGTLEVLDCDAVSADFRAFLDCTPSKLDFDGISGDMDITLPENCGFSVSLDSLSGNFTSDFPTTLSDGHHVYGDGSCRIQADGVSGSITVRNGGYRDPEVTAPVKSTQGAESDCDKTSHDHSDQNHH